MHTVTVMVYKQELRKATQAENTNLLNADYSASHERNDLFPCKPDGRVYLVE